MYSVVVSTCNHAHSLAVTLESLLAMVGGLAHEIIVVDNNSTDGTQSCVRMFEKRAPGKVRYVFEGTPGLSAARNAGVAAARGEIIAFTDDDVIVRPNWLQALAATYEAYPDAWCVGGRVVPLTPDNCPSWLVREPSYDVLSVLVPHLDLGEATIKLEYPSRVVGANLSVRRSLLSRVGMFNTELGVGRFVAGEDAELCFRVYRAGGTVYYCGQAAVVHPVPPARMTKRSARERAYLGGRLDGHPLMRTMPSRKLSHETLLMLKDVIKMLGFYGIGNDRRGLACELAVRKRLGYFQQIALSRKTSPGAMRTRPGPEVRRQVGSKARAGDQ